MSWGVEGVIPVLSSNRIHLMTKRKDLGRFSFPIGRSTFKNNKDVVVTLTNGDVFEYSESSVSLHEEGTPLFIVKYKEGARFITSLQHINSLLIKANIRQWGPNKNPDSGRTPLPAPVGKDDEYSQYPIYPWDFGDKIDPFGVFESRSGPKKSYSDVLGVAIKKYQGGMPDFWPGSKDGDRIGFAAVMLKPDDLIFDWVFLGRPAGEDEKPSNDCMQIVPVNFSQMSIFEEEYKFRTQDKYKDSVKYIKFGIVTWAQDYGYNTPDITPSLSFIGAQMELPRCSIYHTLS